LAILKFSVQAPYLGYAAESRSPDPGGGGTSENPSKIGHFIYARPSYMSNAGRHGVLVASAHRSTDFTIKNSRHHRASKPAHRTGS
jgi:hypothetical protein